MRLLVAIPHYFAGPAGPDAGGRSHGSTGGDPGTRVAALGSALASIQQNFGAGQCVIDIAARVAREVNGVAGRSADVVVCTAGADHLLDRVDLAASSASHRPTDAEPRLLGFACREALRERLGAYDYYAYIEDDLAIRDPWFLAKLRWFNGHLGDDVLLQPNRFEASGRGPVRKAYIDGDIREDATRPFQDIRETPSLRSSVLGVDVRFVRPSNPHSGCYFLNARQMEHWARRPDFLDRDCAFVGPLESAATLGIMRAFRVYKPAPENASFLEIEHHGTAFLGLIRAPSP